MGQHVLRSERVGTLWCGLAVLACLSVEGWRAFHPRELEPLAVSDVLGALEGMQAIALTDVKDAPVRARESRVRFREAIGDIYVANLDEAGWEYWGLSPKQAQVAVRYNNAVGGIKDERTLRRMRVLPEGWVDHFESALRFTTPATKKASLNKQGDTGSAPVSPYKSSPMPGTNQGASQFPTPVTAVPLPLEINSADSLTLLAVKGIGPWVAGRILSSRRQWGGFAELGQLTEAFNGWDSLATALHPLLYCDKDAVQRRCIDTLTLPQWQALPGVSQKTAKVLHRYVRHHEGCAPSQVLAHPLLDSAQSSLLSHYLCPCPLD